MLSKLAILCLFSITASANITLDMTGVSTNSNPAAGIVVGDEFRFSIRLQAFEAVDGYPERPVIEKGSAAPVGEYITWSGDSSWLLPVFEDFSGDNVSATLTANQEPFGGQYFSVYESGTLVLFFSRGATSGLTVGGALVPEFRISGSLDGASFNVPEDSTYPTDYLTGHIGTYSILDTDINMGVFELYGSRILINWTSITIRTSEIPEPGSIAIWLGLASILLVYTQRRSRNEKI